MIDSKSTIKTIKPFACERFNYIDEELYKRYPTIPTNVNVNIFMLLFILLYIFFIKLE